MTIDEKVDLLVERFIDALSKNDPKEHLELMDALLQQLAIKYPKINRKKYKRIAYACLSRGINLGVNVGRDSNEIQWERRLKLDQ